MVVDREKSYCCHQCGKLYCSLSGFKLHQKKHDSETYDVSGRHFVDEGNRYRQLKTLRYHCLMCGFSSTSLQYLKCHLKCHLGMRPDACQICNKTFRKEYLQDHLKTVHQNLRSYHCGTCAKQFKQRNSLTEHIKTDHTGEKPYVCSTCSRAFVRARSLRDHIKSHVRVKKPKKQYSCHLCNNRAFTDKTCWTVHMMSAHSVERPYICDICGKGFKLKSGLKVHTQAHSEERPYGCQLCDSAFKFKKDLRKHQERHKSSKDYFCNICGRGFVTRNDLYLHQRVHDSTKEHRIYKPGKFKVSGGELVTAHTRKNLLSLKSILFDTEINGHRSIWFKNSNREKESPHSSYTDVPKSFSHPSAKGEALSNRSLTFETFLDTNNDSHEFDAYKALEKANTAGSPIDKHLSHSSDSTQHNHFTAMSSCQQLETHKGWSSVETHKGWSSVAILEDYDWLNDASSQDDVLAERVLSSEHVLGSLDGAACTLVHDEEIQNVQHIRSLASSMEEHPDFDNHVVEENIVSCHEVDESIIGNHDMVENSIDGNDKDENINGHDEDGNIDGLDKDENINDHDEDGNIDDLDEDENINDEDESSNDLDKDESINDHDDNGNIGDLDENRNNNDLDEDRNNDDLDEDGSIDSNYEADTNDPEVGKRFIDNLMIETVIDGNDEDDNLKNYDEVGNIINHDEDGNTIVGHDEDDNGQEEREEEDGKLSESDVDLQSLNEYLNEELDNCRVRSLTDRKMDGFNSSLHSAGYGSPRPEDVQESSSSLHSAGYGSPRPEDVQESSSSLADQSEDWNKQHLAFENSGKNDVENSELREFDSIFTPRKYEIGFYGGVPTGFPSGDLTTLSGTSIKQGGKRQDKQLLIDFQMTSCDMFSDTSDIFEDNIALDARSIRCCTPENDNGHNTVSFPRDKLSPDNSHLPERKIQDQNNAEKENEDEEVLKEDDVELIDQIAGKHKGRMKVLEVVSELAHGIKRPKIQRKLTGSDLDSTVVLNMKDGWKHIHQGSKASSTNGKKKSWCEDCGRSYITHTHQAACHSEGSQKFVCHLCGHICNDKRNLGHHLVLHSSAKPYKCDMCQKCFKTRVAVRAHLNRHLPSKMLYRCHQCSQCYNHFNSLQAHKQTHFLGAPIFTCRICGKQLSDKSNLTAHTNRHLVPKKYPCPVCGKELSSVHSLHSHQGRACLKHQLKKLKMKEKKERQLARTKAREERKIMQEKMREMKKRCFFCPLCFKQLDASWKLMHSCARPFHCDLCRKTFK